MASASFPSKYGATTSCRYAATVFAATNVSPNPTNPSSVWTRSDRTNEFVPKRDRRDTSSERVRHADRDDGGPVDVLLHVRATDAAPADAQQQLARAGHRLGHLVNAHITTRVPASRSHQHLWLLA